jgi:ERCC4-related helicase
MQSSSELVQGIDSLSANIPHYAERFAEMASDTEEMAKELEDRMKHLEDGYDYLSKVSSQVPEAIREMSSNYKTGVLDGAEVNLFREEEKKALESEDDKLDHLKRELQSISQERVIVDVFTRSTISRVKSHFTKIGVDNEPVFIGNDRAEKSRIQTRNHALARQSTVDKALKSDRRYC